MIPMNRETVLENSVFLTIDICNFVVVTVIIKLYQI